MSRSADTGRHQPTRCRVPIPSKPKHNRLLQGLPRRERESLLHGCEAIELSVGGVLCEPAQDYGDVYFPLDGVISVSATAAGHPPLEVAQVGNEGMLGATLVIGVATAPHRAVVRSAGRAWCIPASALTHAFPRSPELLRTLQRYLYASLTELSQTTICTRFHDVGERLVRSLLMAHDRVQGDRFLLTHHSLAEMLGVQRSAITIAAGELQKRALISYSRGQISILDRPGLETACCKCYVATAARIDIRH
jgi:CRP-like cAMP-binding protein